MMIKPQRAEVPDFSISRRLEGGNEGKRKVVQSTDREKDLGDS